MCQLQHPATRAQKVQDRFEKHQRRARKHDGNEPRDQQAGGGQRARICHAVCAHRARHDGSDADQHADVQRQVKKAHHTGKTHGGGDGLFPKHGDVKKVDQVDRKNGNQTNGAGARHHPDVAHQ